MTSRSKPVPTVKERLLQVRLEIPYLQKDASGYQFKYVSSSQVLGTIRKAMDDVSLLLIPRIVNVKVDKEKQYFTQLWFEFTWTRDGSPPEEDIICSWYGQGLDTGEKGVGKAATYAEKYFLLKFFNVPTDLDDPDRFQDKVEPKKSKKPSKFDLAKLVQFADLALHHGLTDVVDALKKCPQDDRERVQKAISWAGERMAKHMAANPPKEKSNGGKEGQVE